MNAETTAYIDNSPDEQRLIMQQLRQLIGQSVPQVQENFKWGRPVFSTTKDFAYLKSAKAYVTLGFFNVDKLSDSLHLLEGSGKDMRHIKIKKVADINPALLSQWFKTLAE